MNRRQRLRPLEPIFQMEKIMGGIQVGNTPPGSTTPPPAFVSAGPIAIITTGTSITVTLPPHSPGDLLLVFAHLEDAMNPVAPPGWNLLFLIDNTSDHAVFWKFAGVGEPDPTFSVTSNAGGGAMTALVYEGIDTTTPFDGVATTHSSELLGGSYGTVGSPTITPVSPGAIVVMSTHYRSTGAVTLTDAKGHTIRTFPYADWQNATGDQRGFMIGDQVVPSPAPVDIFQFTSGSSIYQMHGLVLRPA